MVSIINICQKCVSVPEISWQNPEFFPEILPYRVPVWQMWQYQNIWLHASVVIGGFPSHVQSFDVFFDIISLKKLLNKHLRCQWFEMPWHLCEVTIMPWLHTHISEVTIMPWLHTHISEVTIMHWLHTHISEVTIMPWLTHISEVTIMPWLHTHISEVL